MTDYVFDSIPALDPVSGLLAKDSVGLVYAEADVAETTPLPIRDSGGVAKTSVRSGPQGVLEVFITTDHPRVWWVSGGFKFLLTSSKGLEQAAQAAAEAAATSATAAQEAAAKAFRIGRPGATTPAWWGAFTTGTAPTAEEGAVEGDLGVLLP